MLEQKFYGHPVLGQTGWPFLFFMRPKKQAF